MKIQSLDDTEARIDDPTSYRDEPESLAFFDRISKIAFQGISVKLMMTDPVDNYLMGPIADAFANMVDFKHNLLFVSANMVSFCGVVAALVGAVLVTYDSSTMQKLSVLFFQLRTWFDDLDGVVARARMGIYKHVSLSNTAGYYVDGICDAIGFVAYLIGCYFYLKKTLISQNRVKRRHRSLGLLSSRDVHDVTTSTDRKAASEVDDRTNDMEKSELKADSQSDSDAHLINDEESESLISSELVKIDSKSMNQISDEQRQECHSGNQHHSSASGRRPPSVRRVIYTTRLGGGRNGTHFIFYRCIKEKIKRNLGNRRSFLLILGFLLQLAMCSIFWNRYILLYRDLLESKSAHPEQSVAKRKILKSNIMYIIIWFWRVTNGHFFMQMLVVSVFLGKLWNFLEAIKYIGFVEIVLLAGITELHIIDTRNYIYYK